MAEIKKNTANLQPTKVASEGSTVQAQIGHASFKRDPSLVLNAIDTFSKTYEKGKAIKDAKKRDENNQKGKLDASLGREDAALAASSLEYRDGMQEQRTVAKGLTWLNDGAVLLKQRMAEQGTEFDFVEFKRERYEEFLGSVGEDPVAVRAANAMASQFMQQTEAQYFAIKHKQEVEESESLYVTTINETVAANGLKTNEDVQRLLNDPRYQRALEPERLKEIMVNMLSSRVAEGDMKMAALLEPLTVGDETMSVSFQHSKDTGVAHNAQVAAAEQQDRIDNDVETWDRMETKKRNGTFSHADSRWMVSRGYFKTAKEAASWRGQSVENAQAKAEKANHNAAIYAGLMSGVPVGALFGNEDAKKVLDLRMSQYSVLLNGTKDPATRQRIQTQMMVLANNGANNALFSPYLKNRFENIDLSNPAAHKEYIELALRMTDGVGGERMLATHISAEAVAKINVISHTMRRTGNLDAALNSLQHLQAIPIGEAQKRLGQYDRQIGEKAKKVASGLQYGRARYDIERGAVEYSSLGMNETDSIALAVKDYENAGDNVGDRRFSTRGTSQNVGANVQRYERLVLRSHTGEAHPNAYLVQSPEKPNLFIVVDPSDPKRVMHKDGKVMVLSHTDIVRDGWNAEQAAKKVKEKVGEVTAHEREQRQAVDTSAMQDWGRQQNKPVDAEEINRQQAEARAAQVRANN